MQFQWASSFCQQHSLPSFLPSFTLAFLSYNSMYSRQYNVFKQIQLINLEGCLTVHLPHEIKWNANLMQLGNFIDVFLAWYVSGTYAHHQEHYMLSCSIWFSAPSFWMNGGCLESCCVGCVYGADGAVHGTIRTVHTTYAAVLKTTIHPKNSVQKTIRCNSTYNAPDDGHMYPKHV